MNKNSSESTTLIFKNIPNQIQDLTNLLNSLNIPAKEIKPFGRKRALITYELKSETETALDTLKSLEFKGKAPNISLFCKNKSKGNVPSNEKCAATRKSNKSVQTVDEATEKTNTFKQLQISKYVQKLYAIEGDLGFDQPPPPYLKYNYPPINKDILDNICLALLSNKRFYTQVLHLMNRMNLEPPFGKRTYKFTQPGVPKETGTQTEVVIIQKPNLIPNISEQEELESELEISDEEQLKNKPQVQMKRKLPSNDEQYKKKARQVLQNVQKLNKENNKKSTKANISINEIFETSDLTSSAAKIEFHVKKKNTSNATNTDSNKKPAIALPLDLKTQKLSLEDMETLPIFKNYQKGEVSNKLYIKNLHKDVTTEDLMALYQRYTQEFISVIKLDVKVMQHGRMKGQAFVSFLGDQIDIIKPIIAQALDDTNGFILRDKPMVVCYGKQS